jgi:hypothetical protein
MIDFETNFLCVIVRHAILGTRCPAIRISLSQFCFSLRLRKEGSLFGSQTLPLPPRQPRPPRTPPSPLLVPRERSVSPPLHPALRALVSRQVCYHRGTKSPSLAVVVIHMNSVQLQSEIDGSGSNNPPPPPQILQSMGLQIDVVYFCWPVPVRGG